MAVRVLLSDSIRGQEELSPEELLNVPLSQLEPPYTAFRDRDYNRLQKGDPERPEVLVDLPDGDITVESIAECAVECTKTPDCNAASWYGASTEWKDVRNCWLKTLEPACQLPSDAETYDDNRAFLIARPRECNGQPSIAPPPTAPFPTAGDTAFAPEATSDERSTQVSTAQMQDDTDETINTPAEILAVLGDRQMNSNVPNVTEIENGVVGASAGRSLAIMLLGAIIAYVAL